MNQELAAHPRGRTPLRSAAYILVIGILALAALLRLTRLDLAEFKADEAGIAREALALVRDRRFPASGPSSSQGPAHPPLQIYLMALPFAVTRDPRLAVAVVASIHTAAVLMTFLLAERFLGRRAGLIAAFLFAVNPWAIYYARKMWTQNWPLATTLFILALLLALVARRPRAWVGASLALVALAGTHLGGLAFLIVLILAVVAFPRRAQGRPLLIGALIFLAFSAPYLVHDAAHGWENLTGFFDLGGAAAQVDLDAARFAAWLSSGFHYQDLAGARHAQFLEGLPDLRWLDQAEMALLGAGSIYLLARVIRHASRGREHWRARAGRDVILLSWLLVPVLLQTRHSQPVYPHYFILLYPVQFLIIGLALSDGWDWLRPRWGQRPARWFGFGIVGLLLAIGGWQVYLEQRFVRFAASYDMPGGYGPVVGPLWQTASAASAAATTGTEVLVVAPGDDPTWDNLPAAFDALLPRRLARRFVDGREALVYPQGPMVYITTPGVPAAVVTLSAQAGTALLGQVATAGERSYTLFARSNQSRDDVVLGMASIAPPRRLANGVELLAYRVGAAGSDSREAELTAGGEIPLELAWWYDRASSPEVQYHTFAHLVDAAGERWGQHDLAGFPTSSWRGGDLVVTSFQIVSEPNTPPGEYWVRLGMYSYPDIINAAVVDAVGNPVADAVVVGPIPLR